MRPAYPIMQPGSNHLQDLCDVCMSQRYLVLYVFVFAKCTFSSIRTPLRTSANKNTHCHSVPAVSAEIFRGTKRPMHVYMYIVYTHKDSTIPSIKHVMEGLQTRHKSCSIRL